MTANSERKESKYGEQAAPTATHQTKPGKNHKGRNGGEGWPRRRRKGGDDEVLKVGEKFRLFEQRSSTCEEK